MLFSGCPSTQFAKFPDNELKFLRFGTELEILENVHYLLKAKWFQSESYTLLLKKSLNALLQDHELIIAIAVVLYKKRLSLINILNCFTVLEMERLRLSLPRTRSSSSWLDELRWV